MDWTLDLIILFLSLFSKRNKLLQGMRYSDFIMVKEVLGNLLKQMYDKITVAHTLKWLISFFILWQWIFRIFKNFW